MRRETITLGLASGLGLAPALSFAQATQTDRPNVIMILVDDVGYGDFGCYGHPSHNTPNIDRLAKEGIKFTDFHSNGAVSSPTRAALMTGRYQQYSGIEGVITAANHRDVGLPLESTTIAQLLRESGYKTAIYGKWHLGYPKEYNPINFGFDEFVGYVSGNVDYFSHIDQEGYEDWWHNDKLVKEEGYSTYLITEYAERYIKKNNKEPFFLYVAHEATHGPWQGPSDSAIRSIENGEYKTVDLGNDKVKSYKEMVETLDECIGRVMAAVKEAGIEENTLILLVSDNGGAGLSRNAPLSGRKASLLEGGHRVSAMAYWKGTIAAERISDATLATMDILPTVCEATGAKYDKKAFDGESFLGLVTKDAKMPKRTMFWRYGKSIAARKGEWKLLINRADNIESLYNLSTDIGETTNVAAENPKITAKLRKELVKWERNFEGITTTAK